ARRRGGDSDRGAPLIHAGHGRTGDTDLTHGRRTAPIGGHRGRPALQLRRRCTSTQRHHTAPQRKESTMKKRILTGAAMLGAAALALTGCAADTGGTEGGEDRPMVWYADVMDANPVATAVT